MTEHETLERELAYSAARSDVECHCQPVGEFIERWHGDAPA